MDISLYNFVSVMSFVAWIFCAIWVIRVSYFRMKNITSHIFLIVGVVIFLFSCLFWLIDGVVSFGWNIVHMWL